MLSFAVVVLSLASISATFPDATIPHTPVSYRKERILRAMSSGQAITLRLRGGDGAPSYRKQRIIRAVSTGQIVALKLRGGSHLEERLPFGGLCMGCRKGAVVAHAHATETSSAVALVDHTVGGTASSASADRPTPMAYRKQRMLRAVSSGQAVTRRLEC